MPGRNSRKSLPAASALCAALLSLVLADSRLRADDWPQFRGPNRDGKSAETGLMESWPDGGPKLLWSVKDLGKGYSHVAVSGGLVYVTGLVGDRGILFAYTPDGEFKWKADYGPEYGKDHPGARTTPTAHDGLVYVASGVGNVACFEAATGKPVWSVPVFDDYVAPQVKWGYAESLLIDGDNVIVTPCGKKATMIALDRKTGKQVWASKPLGQVSSFCSPLVVTHNKTRMIITMSDVAVLAFDPADGKLLWQHAYQNQRQNHPDTPIYAEGMLYVTSGYGKGAIGLELSDDGKSVKQVWDQKKQDPCHGQAVLVDGYVYGSSHQSISGKWSCVEFKTGKLAWEASGVGKGGSVIYAGGMLYCYSEDGNVGIVKPDPKECRVISTFKVTAGDGPHWAHPVVSGGRLYIRHGDVLMCYDVKQPGK